jgi:hypothetical protein
MPRELAEFTWKSTGNQPEIVCEQLLGGVAPTTPSGRYGPGWY